MFPFPSFDSVAKTSSSSTFVAVAAISLGVYIFFGLKRKKMSDVGEERMAIVKDLMRRAVKRTTKKFFYYFFFVFLLF